MHLQFLAKIAHVLIENAQAIAYPFFREERAPKCFHLLHFLRKNVEFAPASKVVPVDVILDDSAAEFHVAVELRRLVGSKHGLNYGKYVRRIALEGGEQELEALPVILRRHLITHND